MVFRTETGLVEQLTVHYTLLKRLSGRKLHKPRGGGGLKAQVGLGRRLKERRHGVLADDRACSAVWSGVWWVGGPSIPVSQYPSILQQGPSIPVSLQRLVLSCIEADCCK